MVQKEKNESLKTEEPDKDLKMRKLKDFGSGNEKINRLLIGVSVLMALLLWTVVTMFGKAELFLSTPKIVWNLFVDRLASGYFWPDVWTSLSRVFYGYIMGMCVAIPVAFLMGWYRPVRNLIEPWIQFLRTIPPIAYIPIMVVAFGIGENSKVAIIFIAAFLTCSITVTQGILEIDKVLVKAAYTFGAKDRDLFFHIILPASLPYILIAARTALAGSFTTLIAAEMTGASTGLGARIQLASGAARIDLVMLCILVIGILGFIFDRLLLGLEKRLTRWK